MPSNTQNRSVLLVNDTRGDQHFGCQAVIEALIIFLARAGFSISSFQPVGKSWLTDPTFHERAARASAIIVNGEGSIHHSNVKATTLAQIGSFARQTLRIPSVILNATFAENDDKVYQHIKDFDLIAVRDLQSAIELKNFGILSPLVCHDFSLYHDFLSARSAEPNVPPIRIGVTDSIISRITTALEKFCEETNSVNCSIKINHRSAIQTIYQYAKSIASLDLLVTGRYHAVCFAINTRTPFVAIESNTGKLVIYSKMFLEIPIG